MDNANVTWRDVYELLERFRTDMLNEMRAQRTEFVAPLKVWQEQHELYHRSERKGAWRAAAATITLALTLGGLIVAVLQLHPFG